MLVVEVREFILVPLGHCLAIDISAVFCGASYAGQPAQAVKPAFGGLSFRENEFAVGVSRFYLAEYKGPWPVLKTVELCNNTHQGIYIALLQKLEGLLVGRCVFVSEVLQAYTQGGCSSPVQTNTDNFNGAVAFQESGALLGGK